MVKQYRKKVSSRTGGKKLYKKLKNQLIEQDIKISRDKFFEVLRLHNLLVPKLKNYITITNSNHLFKSIKTSLLKKHLLDPNNFGLATLHRLKQKMYTII